MGQVIINGPIAGASATSPVTFEGDTAATRTLTASVATQAAFVINQANYVRLRNLTITNSASGATAVGIIGNTTNNAGTGCSVTKCILNLAAIQTTSYGVLVTATAGGHGQAACRADSITIDSNAFSNCDHGVSVYGASVSAANRGHLIRYNTFNNNYYMGIAMQYNYASMDIIGNNINFPTTSTMGYGLYLNGNNSLSGQLTTISNNKSNGAAYGGIYCNNDFCCWSI